MVRPRLKGEQVMGQTDRRSSSASSSETTIIQCPSCQTKFAIPTQKVVEVPLPRFHCSRCDYLFSLEEGEQELSFVKRTDAKKSSTTEESLVNPQPPAKERKRKSHSKSLEIPKEFEPTSIPGAPHEHSGSLDAMNQKTPRDQLPFDFDISQADTLPNARQKSGSYLSGVQQDLVSTRKSNFENEITGQPDFESERIDSQIYPIPGQPVAKGGAFLGDWRTGWRAAGLLVAPLVCILALLSAAGMYLESDPVLGSKVLALFPAIPHAAPAELAVDNTTVRRVELIDGEVVVLISGSLTNRGGGSFRDIVLEAFAYAPDGTAQAVTKVNASSTLANMGVRRLSLENIQALQKNEPAPGFRLRPGEDHEFAIALWGSEVSEARDFAVRPYSVKF